MTSGPRRLEGKICLVTGGTGGIGAHVAMNLAAMGATVVINGRDPARCAAAAGRIAAASGNALVESLPADLSLQSEVRRLAVEFVQRHTRLDVLINNAGAVHEYRHETAEGFEATLALNHLAPFLLTHLLLERLKAAAPARIVMVNSAAHKDVKAFDFTDPGAKGPAAWRGPYCVSRGRSLLYALTMPWAHPAFLQYAHTKLANMLFTFELARRLEGSGVTVNAVHPGLVATGFSSGSGAYSWFVRRFTALFGLSPERGARTVTFLAASPDVTGISGRYFIKEREAQPSPAALDQAAAGRLWELSERMTGLEARAENSTHQ